MQVQSPIRDPGPPARPVESYGIALVECIMPRQRARLPLASCQRRWEGAQVPASQSERLGSVSSDLRASYCRDCDLGAKRCGKPPRVRKALQDFTRRCRTKDCGQTFSPDVEHQQSCPRCLAKR